MLPHYLFFFKLLGPPSKGSHAEVKWPIFGSKRVWGFDPVIHRNGQLRLKTIIWFICIYRYIYICIYIYTNTRCNKPFENIWKNKWKKNGRALLSRNAATRQLEHVRRTFTRASAGLILRKVIPGDKYGQIVGRKWDGYVWKWRIPQNGSKWQLNIWEMRRNSWGITYFQTTQIVHTENR